MAQPQADAQAARNAAIVALAAQQLSQLWPQVDWASPDAVNAVRTVYGAIVTRYGQASAAVAAQVYDDLRATTGITSEYRAVPADPFPQAAIDKAVESAFLGTGSKGQSSNSKAPSSSNNGADAVETPSGAVPTSDLPVDQRVPARLEDGLQRHVLQPARDTIAENASADPAKPRYVRVPSGPTTCAFCVLLASRELQSVKGGKANFSGYASKQSALFTQNGDKYHRNCDCQAIPIWPGQSAADVSPNFQDFKDMYGKAAADVGSARDLKKILASMRQLHGLK